MEVDGGWMEIFGWVFGSLGKVWKGTRFRNFGFFWGVLGEFWASWWTLFMAAKYGKC